jgi:hypothetical protein
VAREPPLHIALDVELPFGPAVAHVPDLSEDRALEPRAVVHPADRPGDPGVAVRVAPVQFIAVVQVDRLRQRLFRRLAPLQQLLGPVHPQVTVHLPACQHLFLGRVPQLVVGLAVLQLLAGIDKLARVCAQAGKPVKAS